MIRHMRILSALGGILVALASSVHAQAAPSILRVIAVTDRRSDSNLRWARERVENNIDMLQQDRHDYGGHRVRAIALFEQARQQLNLGLAYDNGREDVAPPPGFYRPAEATVTERGERSSDANLAAVRRNIEGVMDVLQRDNHDYGGHRVTALRLLDEGRDQLNAALAWDSRH